MSYLTDKRNALLMNANLGGGRLPSEYQEVEWIGSSGTQYIDTNYIPNNTTKWEIDCSFPYSPSAQILMGGGGIYNSQAFCVGHRYSLFRIYHSDGKYIDFSEVIYDGDKHSFCIDRYNGLASVDNVQKTISGNMNRPTSIYLFAVNNGTSPVSATVYSSKLYESDVLIQDLVPCYRKSDNEIGMYDTVTQTFFTNQGTGTFTKGNDV